MNRPGQPPQRPPSLAPNPALSAPFRGPYPGYGIPSRSVLPGYPNLANHRTAQNMVPQPSPSFLQQQQRSQSNFPFTAGGLQQQSQLQAQHTGQTPIPQTPHPQTQQQSGATSTLPLHIAQATTPSLGTAPSVSSASEVGLDPNDFPALGSIPANASNPTSSTNTTSYASQAGTGAGASGTQAAGGVGGNQPRDFTLDDFPALGGQSQTAQQQQQQQQQNADGHPPGLNGLQHADQQHRQNLLGSLTGLGQPPVLNGQQLPGVLNLGQARFQADSEKQRNYALKLNQNNISTAPVAWGSPNANPSAQQANTYPSGTTLQNGAQQNNPSQQQLSAPPGVPPPTTFGQQQTQPMVAPPAQQTPYIGNGTTGGDTAHHPSQGPAHATTAAPQTPAQQVLMSPADRWGLLGLLAMIKSADPDQNLLSVGTDLGTMGLDMQTQGSLYSTFITPWADSSAAHTVEPDFHLPACYNVQPAPPGPNKAAAFSDETLFFMFYSSPRDALQEIAAQELWNRSWRYHKELRIWLTKESGTSVAQKVPGGEHGTYTYWDPENWERARKEMTVLYADLEEKTLPVFAPGPTLQLNTPQQHQQAQPAQRIAPMQGMSIAAM
ncbi:uncharacterized protein LAESUDRAFT_691377 [Laetiporus sulphureus 93-53]|uniref:NOT2/NOT3/NOT5 C-terminal domain-containing protein n=1 Tax=Laetiporus sulphureus 93-53 TaxID=1314785 RepID=A0A165HTP0_9APHY|nr:uncharacterized protein LAESUDRAFT_691377 [Laetiporus sulphureus 93-53]KZT12175.1 hypothetical protein LAESUDRAFT_691377 [Laetiporus sulphureus 93-53]